MTVTTSRRAIDAVLMRGGSSRGPVLLAESLPEEQAARDEAVLRLVGGEAVQTDGLGGGSPTTCKVVVIDRVAQHATGMVLDYSVGNIVVGHNAVDWSGTCGNMTAAVPLYALEENIIDASWNGPLRLRNKSTGGLIDTVIAGMNIHERGQEALVTTRYLDPSGAVLGCLLPTGAGMDRIALGSMAYQTSLVDVTHPYLFLLYDEVVGNGDVRNLETLRLIERLRGEVCVRLGLAASPDSAALSSPAVPRVVLIHRRKVEEDCLRISAISMGQAIATVPVSAAMCLAAACHIPSTLPALNSADHANSAELRVISIGASLSASAAIDPNGNIASVSVDRTVRTIMRGTAWI